jgi:uncharacterized protein (DUF3084 family)
MADCHVIRHGHFNAVDRPVADLASVRRHRVDMRAKASRLRARRQVIADPFSVEVSASNTLEVVTKLQVGEPVRGY